MSVHAGFRRFDAERPDRFAGPWPAWVAADRRRADRRIEERRQRPIPVAVDLRRGDRRAGDRRQAQTASSFAAVATRRERRCEVAVAGERRCGQPALLHAGIWRCYWHLAG